MKNNRIDEIYHRSIENKSEATLKTIAEIMVENEEDEFDSIEKESETFIVPEETHDKLVAIIKAEERKARRDSRRNKIKKVSRVCAVTFLVICVSGVFMINTVDAFKYRFNNFWVEVKTEYLGLTPKAQDETTNNKVLEELKGLWYPEYFPEGYSYDEYDKMGNKETLIFKNEQEKMIKLSFQDAVGTTVTIDNEAKEKGTAKVNENDAYWIINEDVLTIIWMQSDIIVTLRGEFDLKEALKIAESLGYVK